MEDADVETERAALLALLEERRRRFSTTITFESYTPDELWQLSKLSAAQDVDIVAPATEEVLGPVFARHHSEESTTPAGDVIRGIDWLGNGRLRNLIEKARDHRNNRLDTDELDELLAADSFDAADDDLMRRFCELIPEDFAEGLRLAVTEAERGCGGHSA